ncbi:MULTISPECIES: reprolysin-like metallopeptidase [unclassified Chryseobacterium]|uniref:reprolysin-like metallopeptidase n=1 Tax=unclassified Chryseobacterium TaxID=2593645 RepID=UPI00226A1C44|nr:MULTISPECIES: zinc-dependent metalloprotease family protein [unclassified Chryseobacterium]
MKKIITALFCSLIGGSAVAQWTPTTFDRQKEKFSHVRQYYKLDLGKIREQLKNAQETGPNAKPVEISLPTLHGKVEKFAVYSFPVVVKSLAEQYQLGSYVGVGIDDPTKFLRFSVAPNDFQSMIIKDGEYEFIEPQDAAKTVYGVHPKTQGNKNGFACSTNESPEAIKQINGLLDNGKSFTNQPTNFAKTSDKKYRTMRLVMSVTGEYTQYHGGTKAGALAAINATMTRVNGVFEKDFALHLNLQDYDNVIFTDAATDPYTDAVLPSPQVGGAAGAWNLELQNTLTNMVGNTNYDVGHLFGATGGGGNAGCIGCVCVDPTTNVPKGKGSGYTSPANGVPQGDTFDIDYVAHELGHQLGANHTFSQSLEPYLVNVEPGSGSTIMGYAGITGANTDVQANSDSYFHNVSIRQVQANLIAKTCDVETSINNNPPVIDALPTYTIPKGTAFVLTANATDPENDPLTYTWEQVNSGEIVNNSTTAQAINKNNIGTTTYGASFRSFTPTTSPTRYFPKLSSVLAGVLDNSNNGWESVSKVARSSKFAVTVRDNNPDIMQRQTQYAEQTITVGNDGPFQLTVPSYLDYSAPVNITWDVANTTASPYSVANVKIDYTTDPTGASWTTLVASTPNDGSEGVTLPASTNGQNIKIRISSIGNVFYAVKAVNVTVFATCGEAAKEVTTTNITQSSATANWPPVVGATSYVIRYKKLTDAAWQQITSSTNTAFLNSLADGTAYEVQVAAVCSGTTGTFSPSANFTTLTLGTYCAVSSGTAADDHIANVAIANISNTSSASTYTSYVANSALQINLVAGSTNTLTVTKGWLSGTTPYPMATSAWIDFNRNGTFEDSERILTSTATTANPVSTTFTLPANAVTGLGLRMRVGALYTSTSGSYIGTACGVYTGAYGEFEDYNVVIAPLVLATNDVKKKDNFGIYPNPVSDILNVTKVSNKATYEIHNTVGQIVKKGTIDNNKVNVTELLKGNYIISVKDNNISESFKFIKK